MVKEENNMMGLALILLIIILMIIIYLWIVGELMYKFKDDVNYFRYQVSNREILAKVTVDEILKEKDEEERYFISVYEKDELLDQKEISETIYSSFIGEENNAVRIMENSLCIYMAKIGLFTKRARFNDGLYSLKITKLIYPWRNDKPMDEDYARNMIEKGEFMTWKYMKQREIKYVDPSELCVFEIKENKKSNSKSMM